MNVIEKAVNLGKIHNNMRKLEEYRIDYLNELHHKINSVKQITGYSLDDLLRLFAAGWTLQPPSTTAINLADYTQEDDE